MQVLQVRCRFCRATSAIMTCNMQVMINRSPILYSDRMVTAFSPTVAAAVRRAARERGVPVSAYLRQATVFRLINDGVVEPPTARPLNHRSPHA